MTDSVRCSMDSNRVFTCEVELDSDFDAPNVASPPASPAQPTLTAAPPPADPAVSSLVRSFSSPVAVAREQAPMVSADSLLHCLSAQLAVPLALANKTLLGPLAGFKAGYDLGHCLAEQQDNAAVESTLAKAKSSCEADGGIVTSVVESRVSCNMTAVSQ